MPVTPFEALRQHAHARPEASAFIFQEDVWSYRRLLHAAECVARGLVANGVKPGDRVVLHMLNRPEMLVAYYACFRLGAIAVPLRTAFTFAELAPMLQRLQPALYIGEAGLYPNVAAVDAAILPGDRRFLVDDPDDAHGVRSWQDLSAATSTDLPAPATYQPAVMLNTSGTTGQPKFVMHTPDSLAAMTELVHRHFGISADDIFVLPAPLAHASGLFCTLICVRIGLPFILIQGVDADIVLDHIERHRGTRLLGFPYQYAALVEAQQARPRDLSSLRVCLTGADVCPIELQKRAASVLGAPVHNIWAASEVLGQLTFALQPGPVVRIAEASQVRLVDDDGADVDDGEIGELLIRGANVFAGYWNDPAATAQALRAGWYHTGDLMRRGEGDELWFMARKKDIIIRGGTNISPAEVEDALVACHPAVKEAGVVGRPDPVLGQRVFGFVRLAPGTRESVIAEILQNVAHRLALYKVPEELRVIDVMPRNALGKVDRRRLEAMVVEEDAGRSAA